MTEVVCRTAPATPGLLTKRVAPLVAVLFPAYSVNKKNPITVP